ncbi:OTU domain-containing protein [Hyalangium versicolor]|uniref:OTU domain-containing protein n=1 Tax=Hyalangium versicolor TaxID=2861190 RepID=UPI001CCFC312|nr:OTU domain-containing protein [Hyalangium versicolor]
MKCANSGCYNRARKNNKYCDRCWQRHQKSEFPLEQSRRDIERLRGSSGHFVRASSVEVEREPPPFFKDTPRYQQQQERRSLLERSRQSPESVRIRERSSSPVRERKRRRIDDEGSKQKGGSSFPSFEISKESRRSRVELPILFVPFEGNFSNRMMGGYEKKGNQTSSIVEGGGGSFVIHQGRRTIDEGDMSSSVGSSSHWTGMKGEVTKRELFGSNKKSVSSRLSQEKTSTDRFFEMVVMAAYVLDSAAWRYRFSSTQRSSKCKGSSFTETWLLISERSSTPEFTIACVHLSSKYTTVRTDNMESILNEVLVFARTKGVHALIGDFNLNTYGVHGGSFSVSNEFIMEKQKLSMKTTFGTSNGGGDSVYMGGMICDSRVSFRPTLTTTGCCAVPPWFQFDSWEGEVFSDHHSLYGRYVFYGEERVRQPSNEAGGDCSFVALRARLGLTEGVDALRRRIIDGITNDVVANTHLAGPRSILVQRPNSDSAVPVWCTSMRAYLTEMRKPGRWMEDTLLPYVAVYLRCRIIVQYGDHHAVFGVDGGRDEGTGFIWPEGTDIFMNCQGNHFWL